MRLCRTSREIAAPTARPTPIRIYPAGVPSQPAVDPEADAQVLRLSPAGRLRRLLASFIALALLLVGTVWGDDDSFPFGPFRMYSTRNDPDAPVISTRVVGLTAAGEEVRLSAGQVGLRRAEFEGQVDRIRANPELLGLVADSFAESHPSAPDLVSVEFVQRRYELADGKPTGEYTDRVVVEYVLEDAGS
jgi:hypothetical protein